MAYCTPADVTTIALPASAIPSGITLAQQQAACNDASSSADAKMRARYPLPITGSIGGGPGVFDPSIVRYTAYMAAYIIMSFRGFNPSSAADRMIVENNEKAIAWFDGVERGNVHPDVTVTQPAPPTYQLPQIISKRPRGI